MEVLLGKQKLKINEPFIKKIPGHQTVGPCIAVFLAALFFGFNFLEKQQTKTRETSKEWVSVVVKICGCKCSPFLTAWPERATENG